MSGMEKLSDLLEMAKVSDIIATKKEKEEFVKALFTIFDLSLIHI